MEFPAFLTQTNTVVFYDWWKNQSCTNWDMQQKPWENHWIFAKSIQINWSPRISLVPKMEGFLNRKMRLFWGSVYPLHKPYIHTAYISVSTSILDTWYVWWNCFTGFLKHFPHRNPSRLFWEINRPWKLEKWRNSQGFFKVIQGSQAKKELSG